MEIKDIQKKQIKKITISIRTTEEYSKFLKEKNISPTALFNQAIKELKV